MLGKHHCITVIIINSLGILANGQGWPIKLIEEGKSAVIPCIPQGHATSFFWKREGHNTSSDIAYNVDGVAGPESEKFYVFSNGSLLLQNMTVMDEGIYYCRIASDRSECRASVTVYLKATNTTSLPYIDRCSPNKGCIIYEKPFSTISLTCKAHQVSSDMELKWFNDSKEITENVKESKNENDMNETIISSSIKVRYDGPRSLTCQASSIKMETSFAHVQLQSEPVQSSPAGIIVLSVILVVTFAVLLGYILYTFIKRKRQVTETKQPDEGRTVEGEPLVKEPEESNTELEKVKEELSEEKKNRAKEIDSMKAELDQLKNNLLEEQSRAQEAEKELSAEKAKRSVEDNMKKKLEEKLQSKESELQKLERVKIQQSAINVQGKGLEEKLQETVDKFMLQLEEKDKKIQKTEVELRFMSEALQLSQQNLQATNDDVTSLGLKLESMEAELKSTKENLHTTKDTLKAKQTILLETEEKLQLSDRNLKAAKDELKVSLRSNELFQRQQRSNVLEGKDNYTTLCRIKTPKRKAESFITRIGEEVLKTKGSEYKYSFIFPDNATRKDIFSRLEDLVQNAIDGGSSTIIVHGNSSKNNLYLMYGSGDDIDEGLVVRTIRKIFEVSRQWSMVDYKAEVNASFAKIFPGRESQFLFIPVEGDGNVDNETKYIYANDNENVKAVKVPITSKETAILFLKKYTVKRVDHAGSEVSSNDFVQFFIATKFQSSEISSGTLTFVLYNDAEALKDCFTDHNKTLMFPRYFSSMINAEGSKIAILSNIDEENKQQAKDQLNFTNWIFEKKSFWKKFVSR